MRVEPGHRRRRRCPRRDLVDFCSAVNPNEASLTPIGTFATDSVNFVHLNDAGYAVVAQQLIDTAALDAVAVPAPPGGVLAAVGCVAVLGRRVRVSRKTFAAA